MTSGGLMCNVCKELFTGGRGYYLMRRDPEDYDRGLFIADICDKCFEILFATMNWRPHDR